MSPGLTSLRVPAMMLLMLSLIGIPFAVGLASAQDFQRQLGNDEISALCGGDGYKRLTRQDGTPFASERDCVRYARRNGGVKALATAAPKPPQIARGLVAPSANIKIKPLPLFPATPTAVPTNAPYPSPWIYLHLYYTGAHCTVSAYTNTLAPGTSYIVSVHIKDKSGETLVYEKEILHAPSKYDEHLVPVPVEGLPSVVTVYLFEIQGDTMIQRDFDGPLHINEQCSR